MNIMQPISLLKSITDHCSYSDFTECSLDLGFLYWLENFACFIQLVRLSNSLFAFPLKFLSSLKKITFYCLNLNGNANLHFAGNLQLICGGKTALHANSSSEAIGLEDWGTVHCEVEVMIRYNPYASCHEVCTPNSLLQHCYIECCKGRNFVVVMLIWILI